MPSHKSTFARVRRRFVNRNKIPRERVSLQLGHDQRVETVVLLAHIDRPRVREDVDTAR